MLPKRVPKQRNPWVLIPLQSKFPTSHVPAWPSCIIRVSAVPILHWIPLFSSGWPFLTSVGGCFSLTGQPGCQCRCCSVTCFLYLQLESWKRFLVSLAIAKTLVCSHILLFLLSQRAIPFLHLSLGMDAASADSHSSLIFWLELTLGPFFA